MSSATTATPATGGTAPLVRKQNPKDSTKTTWHKSADRSQWSIAHYFFHLLDLLPADSQTEVPKYSKDDKVPALKEWKLHFWIVSRTLIPLALHYAYVKYTGNTVHPLAAFAFYSVAVKLFGINVMHMLRRVSRITGFLDGQHERDVVPDVGVAKVMISLISTSTFRPMIAVFLAYNRDEMPHVSWLTPLYVSLYCVVLDFYFYWYHRAMHESNLFGLGLDLWRFHRTHHLTKHPNPLLTLYADEEQEFFDVVGIPLMAYGTIRLMGLPFGFYDWWCCSMYVMFTELAGHSGLRLYTVAPSPISWLLPHLGADLMIEDHDLHHRKGWKASHNYGKQTRVWDRLFGTTTDRIELTADKVDWDNRIDVGFL